MKNNLRGTLIIACVVGVSVLLAGCGKKEMISVNGQKVSRDEFFSRLEQVPVQTNTGPRLAGDHVVRKLIDEMLIIQYAQAKGVPPTDQQVNARIERVKRQQGPNFQLLLKQGGMSNEDFKHQQAVEQAFYNVISKNINISDADVNKTYQQALRDPKSGLKRPDQVAISIIAVGKAKLALVQKRLNSGEDFRTVAMELSEDPTKAKGGELGVWVDRSMTKVPPVILQTAFATGVTKFSDPVFVQGKYYFIRVNSKRDAKTTSYDEVKDLIKERMSIAKGMQLGQYKQDMKNYILKAKIEIVPAKYKDIAKEIKATAGTEKGNASTAAPQ